MFGKGLARRCVEGIELLPRTPLGESGTARRRGSIRRGNPPQQPGDADAGTGVEELSTGSIIGPVARRALVAHTYEGPSPICPWARAGRASVTPELAKAWRRVETTAADLPNSARGTSRLRGRGQVEQGGARRDHWPGIPTRPQFRTPSCGDGRRFCGGRGPSCGRHADGREIAEIVGDSPCAGGLAGHRTSLTFSSGRTGSAGEKIHTTGRLVAVAG